MKVICIDLWGTLLQLPEQRTLDVIIQTLNIPINHRELIQKCDRAGLFSRTIDSLTIWKSVLEEFSKTEQEIQEANTIWLSSSREVAFFPGTKEFLTAIKSLGYRVVLTTAVDRDSFAILREQCSFSDYFDDIKTTFQVGLGKSVAFYQKVCHELEISPDQAIMIGDTIDYDILPPQKIGMKAIFLSRYLLTDYEKDLLKDTCICKNYEEILKTLGKYTQE